MIRDRSWAGHPLGEPAHWPADLRTALSLILNSPESMILAWGPDLSFFFNDAYTPLLGPRAAWSMGERFDKVWEDAWAQAKPIIDDAFAGRPNRFVDLPWELGTDRGAAQTWWTFSYSRILDARGEVAGLFIFTNETTERVIAERERQQAEAALRAERDSAQGVLDTMGEAFALLDSDLRILDMNAVALRMEGRPREEVIGLTHWEAHPAADPEIGRLFLHTLSTGEPVTMEHQYRWDDGRETWIEMRAYAIRDRIAVFYRDVTDRNVAAAKLRDLNENLERRVLEEVAERTRTEDALRQAQKMEAVGQLTGGIAHDFNNLLAAISGSLELIRTRIGQGRLEDVERYIGAARGATQRAAALTHRLLAFSRQQTLDPKTTDISHLVFGMTELIRRTVGPSITIRVETTPDLWATLVDRNQLENALLNLCINARDAMPNGGEITIKTDNSVLDDAEALEVGLAPGAYVALCVIDTGVGMEAEVMARAFDPFFTTKPIGQGTGLGLSMVYGFVKQSSGQVHITSEVGHGTTICIRLPRSSGTPRLSDDLAAGTPVDRLQGSQTTLVVDDEATIRMLVSEVLEEAGYTILQAGDAAEAMTVLQSDRRIDLLITDVGLPGNTNGRQLADAARERRPGLKVLFITGYAEKAAVGYGDLAPGMQVLTKPFAMDVLFEAVRGLTT